MICSEMLKDPQKRCVPKGFSSWISLWEKQDDHNLSPGRSEVHENLMKESHRIPILMIKPWQPPLYFT